MSQRLRMLINNVWDTATLTATKGTVVSTLPLKHSQSYGRSKTVAITPDAAHKSQINFNLDSLALVSGLVMYRHWMSIGATWQLELYDGVNQSGSKVFDSQIQAMTPTKTLGELDWLSDNLVSSALDTWPYQFSQLWFKAVFAFSGRLTLTDDKARDGLHEFDRIYLGNVIQPQFNFDYGHQHTWATTTTQKVTAGGSVYGIEKPSTRQFNLNLSFIREEERPHFSEAIRKVGLAKDFFISMFPGHGGIKELEYAMACKFTSLPPISGNFHHNYTLPINVREA